MRSATVVHPRRAAGASAGAQGPGVADRITNVVAGRRAARPRRDGTGAIPGLRTCVRVAAGAVPAKGQTARSGPIIVA